ncbi:unnamed protein product [Rotaria sp. Silwood1]|nr:unnamed protein product [Rotaria sp. Silwood1]CAF3389073.1 unnamed protein product [Rotaria sp. Silwood1]CAF3935890.1 unnamed protein product [Rotaria sp. Silwood1]CAF4717942.1 unnamed protein product [Rotaria sp. Silwood1]CAF4931812.1 unnamed protein product [Rotaria sp. Silwood1]
MYDIDGDLLLTSVDDDILKEDIGITTLLHRRLILKAIDELKKSCSSEFPLTTATTSNKNKDFSKQFEGDFTPLLPMNEMILNETYPNVSSCELTEKRHPSIVSHIHKWVGCLPSGRKIDKIEHVFNSNRYRVFLGQLEAVENRQYQQAFQPNLNNENSRGQRKNVLKRLEVLCQLVKHNRDLPIARMWHGCRKNDLRHILSDGFAALSSLDDGYFGKGIYFSSSTKYVTRYCGGKGGCLIMCYILISNPFPIVTADAPPSVPPERFRFFGKGNHKNYQCHYIPVSPTDDGDEWDFRPPSSGIIDDAIYDELVVFQEAYILPQIVVHLK